MPTCWRNRSGSMRITTRRLAEPSFSQLEPETSLPLRWLLAALEGADDPCEPEKGAYPTGRPIADRQGKTTRAAMCSAAGPLMRTRAIAPRPAAVAIAAMVSLPPFIAPSTPSALAARAAPAGRGRGG